MRLQHLRVVAEATHFLGGGRDIDAVLEADADHVVEHLGTAQVVADEADATDALQKHRCLPIWAALHEFFESSEFHHMQLGISDSIVIVKLHDHLAVTLDAGYWINDQFSAHGASPKIIRSD
ncbi:MAG: hypothetical protein DDT26_02560 [Dehalococcoidia bacterium]|nr:hypothetical protein [Chloroflexota bacterium]